MPPKAASTAPTRQSSRIAAGAGKSSTAYSNGNGKDNGNKAEKKPAAASKRKVVNEGAEDKAAPSADEDKGEIKPDDDGDNDEDDEEAFSAPAPAKKQKTAGSGQLEEGDPMPVLILKDEAGNEVDIAALKNAVIFSYPKANTGGCTKQACCFRDDYASWSELKMKVFGLSNDNPTPLKNWKEKKNFPYALLSDPERKLIGALTGSKTSTKRSHFVIDGEGKLAHSALGVKPAESSQDALKIAKDVVSKQ